MSPRVCQRFGLCCLGVLAGLPVAAAESGTRLAEPPLSGTHLLETVGGLVLVLALILGLAWMLKRLGHLPGAGKGGVQILGGVSLGPRERAVLLSVDGTRLLVGVAPGRVQTLHVLARDAAADSGEFVRRLQDAVTPEVAQ